MPKRNRAAERAHYHTQKKLGEGSLRREPCEICGAEPAECHHIDYADPDRIMWLCKAHHEQTHSQFGKPAPLDWMADIRAAQKRIEAQRPSLARGRAARPCLGSEEK
jgi:hypothetical protein